MSTLYILSSARSLSPPLEAAACFKLLQDMMQWESILQGQSFHLCPCCYCLPLTDNRVAADVIFPVTHQLVCQPHALTVISGDFKH